MNHDPIIVNVETEASGVPPGCRSTVRIRILEEIEEVGQYQNGMVRHLGSYRGLNVSNVVLQPRSFTPRNISQLLNLHFHDTQFCQLLGQRIALDCADIRRSFLLSVHVLLIRTNLFLLPPPLTVSSRAASDDVLQRLADEQIVESVDLEVEEEEGPPSCSICMENLSGQESGHENIIKMPGCLHKFHQACIFEWLKRLNSCPLCRRVPYGDVDREAMKI